MKSQAITILAVLTLIFAWTAAPAYAQSPVRLTAKIPFGFVVGKQAFPAGVYTLRPHSGGGFPTWTAFVIQSVDHKYSHIVLTQAGRARRMPDSSELVFKRYGESYFLSQVLLTGVETGRQLPIARRMLELAKVPADAKAEEVAVIAAAQ